MDAKLGRSAEKAVSLKTWIAVGGALIRAFLAALLWFIAAPPPALRPAQASVTILQP